MLVVADKALPFLFQAYELEPEVAVKVLVSEPHTKLGLTGEIVGVAGLGDTINATAVLVALHPEVVLVVATV
jgi:hypothetical protein